jgi:hypothetical protein
VNHARWDLCGGCSAMGIPTAIGTVFPHLVVETWLRNLRTYGASVDAKAAGNLPASASATRSPMDSISPLEHVSPIEWDNLELCGQYPRSEARPPAPARKKVRP